MKSILLFAFSLTIAAATPSTMAADQAEHNQHHSDASQAKTSLQNAPKSSSVQVTKMDAQMQSMRDMHEKMMNAKTPDERNGLMSDQMKTMQDGMSMMKGMMGAASTSQKIMSPQQMQQQMEMMQTMMQMMMDRMGMQAPSK